ncbi:hypothetical protein [Ramlibacter humi]|uniref:Glycosyltransferase RgtA/B/C/D-like domain-containing protein n=1 Tax=Ramlibacter humi TaxID=2530451 RepID=A0A4Z0BZ69_9BURK|nr:hypothetical protein [Ramlibacter humi]TFZ03834.1 hypothetical protein EZ216_09285 [Ramlibacter humi]
MIETSPLAWTLMALLLILATGAGLALSSAMPWSNRARDCGLPLAAGAAVGPFLTGLLAVAALGLLPGRSSALHAGLVMGVLAVIAVWRSSPILQMLRHPRGAAAGLSWAAWLLRLLLFTWIGMLLVDSIFMPLTQNDALEYTTVGRLLFQTRDLSSYPAIDPSIGSGFYGPWTHPPLYVAMIYLSHAVQAHALEPGLARLVAPWFLLTALTLVAAVGRMHSRASGIGAALVFIGAPLLYLGAGSALIDALPVAGFALVLAAIVGFAGIGARPGVFQGLLLGAALWTHSQAILFIPLALAALAAHQGLRMDRKLLANAAVLLATATAVAAWPYARNVAMFGSAVSDNPAVFAMPQLQWPIYFQMARGYESWGEKLQYGVFKGWTMVEAYAASFWLALPGLWLFVRRARPLRSLLCAQPGTHAPEVLWLRGVAGVFGCYLAGVLLSVLLGIDLMIRNERYQLVLLPCVSWLAGIFIAEAANAAARSQPRAVARAVAIPFCVLLAGTFGQQIIVVGGHKARTYGVHVSTFFEPLSQKMRDYPAYEAVRYLAQETPADALVLSLKPADMYYAERRMVSYLDPRLLPVYAETDAARMREALLGLGIRYLHVPDYALPPLYRTPLEQLMARPDLSALVYSVGGHQVYDLKEPGNSVETPATDLSPGARAWTSRQAAVLGGRVGLIRLPMRQRVLAPGQWSRPEHDWPLFRRELTTLLATGTVDGRAAVPPIRVEGGHEYRLDLDLEGHAFAAVYLVQYDEDGRALDLPHGGRVQLADDPAGWSFLAKQRVGEAALVDGEPPRRFARRFVTYEQTRSVGIIVEHRGATSLRLLGARLRAIRDRSEKAVAQWTN